MYASAACSTDARGSLGLTTLVQPADVNWHLALRQQDGWAGAPVGPVDVDRPACLQTFDLPYFDRRRMHLSRNYQQHNAALKWFRGELERRGESSMQCGDTPMDMPQIVHAKGTDWTWNHAERVHWCWLDMVAQLKPDDLKYVVQGPENRSRGIEKCVLQESTVDDYQRHAAVKAAGQMGVQLLSLHGQDVSAMTMRQWHFILTRDDESVAIIKPGWSNTKVEYRTAVAEDPHESAETNWGGRSGPGTFKYFKDKGVVKTLRFDCTLNLLIVGGSVSE